MTQMAEFGIIASALQVADVGVRLGVKFYHFTQAVKTADETILFISRDVSHTSSVIKELARCLEEAIEAGLCSDAAHRTATNLIDQCWALFEEIDQVLAKRNTKVGMGRGNRTSTKATFEHFKWPFVQPKVKLMRAKLTKLTSTLHLMLNVMIYASTLTRR